MKKLLVALLALLMVLTLTACGKKDEAPVTGGEEPTGEEATFDVNAVDVSSLKLANTKEYVYSDSREVASMDYLVTALASDHQYNVTDGGFSEFFRDLPGVTNINYLEQ